jgi:hypothetical protein
MGDLACSFRDVVTDRGQHGIDDAGSVNDAAIRQDLPAVSAAEPWT